MPGDLATFPSLGGRASRRLKCTSDAAVLGSRLGSWRAFEIGRLRGMPRRARVSLDGPYGPLPACRICHCTVRSLGEL